MTRSMGTAEDRTDQPLGVLRVTKECSAYTGLAGSFCTITSSNVEAIPAGSTVVYESAAVGGSLDSHIVLHASPHDRAVGHVVLDLETSSGTVTFAGGGTGQLADFHATADISYDGALWAWDGTYRWSPIDSHEPTHTPRSRT